MSHEAHKAKQNKLEGYFWNSCTFSSFPSCRSVCSEFAAQLSQSIWHIVGHTFPLHKQDKEGHGIQVLTGCRQRCALPFGPFDVALARPARALLGHPMWQSLRCVPCFCEDRTRKTLTWNTGLSVSIELYMHCTLYIRCIYVLYSIYNILYISVYIYILFICTEQMLILYCYARRCWAVPKPLPGLSSSSCCPGSLHAWRAWRTSLGAWGRRHVGNAVFGLFVCFLG